MLSRHAWLLPLLLAGCTSKAEPTNASSSVACADRSGAPEAYDLAIDDAHVRVSSSPVPVVIAQRDAPPYMVKLQTAACGPRVDVSYVVIRLETPDDAAAVFELMGPPPGVDVDVPPPKAVSPQRFEGTKQIVRGEEIVLGEGAWPDGKTYRVRLAAR